MRHVLRLDHSLTYGFHCRIHLVFVAGNLRLTVVNARLPVVGVVHRYRVRIVDVVDNHIALVARHNPHAVVGTACRGLHDGHFTTRIDESHAVLQVYTKLVLRAARHDTLRRISKQHERKVDGINAQVEQRAAAQFRPAYALLMLYRITKIGRQHAWAAYQPAAVRHTYNLL